MATTNEIKEDFIYLSVVEFAILIGVSANSVYVGDFKTAFLYSLIFIGVLIFQRSVMISLLIPKKKDIREIFDTIMREKKNSKRMIVFLLFLLIILSSWGIVSYITKFYMESRDYTKILTLVIPWYIAIYGGWLGYLIYLKSKYTKFLISLLSKKKKTKTMGVFLYHGNKYITTVPVDRINDKNLEKEISMHSEDFRYEELNVAVENLGKLKLALVRSGPIDSKVRVNMKGALKAIKISFPKKFESGNYNEGEIREIENIIRRYLFA